MLHNILLLFDVLERKVDHKLSELIANLETRWVHHSSHLTIWLLDQTYLLALHQFQIMHLDKQALILLTFNTYKHKVIFRDHHYLSLHEVKVFLRVLDLYFGWEIIEIFRRVLINDQATLLLFVLVDAELDFCLWDCVLNHQVRNVWQCSGIDAYIQLHLVTHPLCSLVN